MASHVDTIVALLGPVPGAVLDTDVPTGTGFPRLIVLAPDFMTEPAAMAGPRPVNDLFQVKAAGVSVGSARQTLAAAKAVLDGAHGTANGWTYWIRKVASSPFMTDRDVTLPATNSQVVAGTDTYRYRAVLAALEEEK